MLVGVAVLVGLLGIVIPVLPGSLLIGGAVLVWAVVHGSGTAWATFAGVAVLLAIGSVITYVVATKRTRAAGVPTASLVAAGIAGIVGFFVVPVVGLLLFFPIGLYLMEWRRLGDPAAARTSALVALKATGLGMLLELALALAAAGLWLTSVLWWA